MARRACTARRTQFASDQDEADYRDRLQGPLGDGYGLCGLIGRGGFGAVYVARDRRLDREVAATARLAAFRT